MMLKAEEEGGDVEEVETNSEVGCGESFNDPSREVDITSTVGPARTVVVVKPVRVASVRSE